MTRKTENFMVGFFCKCRFENKEKLFSIFGQHQAAGMVLQTNNIISFKKNKNKNKNKNRPTKIFLKRKG